MRASLIYRRPIWISLAFLFAFLAAVISYLQSPQGDYSIVGYPRYNNYLIFKSSFLHLWQHRDLYLAYPQEHWDYFKYTPTFALFFGIFALFPDFWGLLLWDSLNSLLYALGLLLLPQYSEKEKGLLFYVTSVELFISLQNHQSNALLAALFLLSFRFLENKKDMWAALCMAASFYVKLFGIIFALLFLFYEEKKKKILYLAGWLLFLGLLPLVVISPAEYGALLGSYYRLLRQDAIAGELSFVGWLEKVFGCSFSPLVMALGAAVLIFILALMLRGKAGFGERLAFLCSLLLFSVLFNHKAESPSYVLAVCGVGLWFFRESRVPYGVRLFLLLFVIVFTSLGSTDLFPEAIRQKYLRPWGSKVVPVLLVYLTIVGVLLASGLRRLKIQFYLPKGRGNP
ncbi:MAG: DUF2029 domain-containing protein [Leptospiraceae bacterium]|nr:DUF2029 domain-containing protein [Leptospiraceae bacterium]MDW8306612.1 glycosyltransferase family 87 protein [Leptospiraceae bacterium]